MRCTPLTPPKTLNPAVSDATNGLVLKMMANHAKNRFQNIKSLLAAMSNDSLVDEPILVEDTVLDTQKSDILPPSKPKTAIPKDERLHSLQSVLNELDLKGSTIPVAEPQKMKETHKLNETPPDNIEIKENLSTQVEDEKLTWYWYPFIAILGLIAFIWEYKIYLFVAWILIMLLLDWLGVIKL